MSKNANKHGFINPVSTKNLQIAIDRILQVDTSGIANQLLSIDKLQECVDCIDPEFNQYNERHCNKTGKPLGKLSSKAISQLIHIHGNSKARFALECTHLSQYAIEWLYTDDNALGNLSKSDPVGYFIYAASELLQPDFKKQKLDEWEIHLQKVNGWKTANQFFNISIDLFYDSDITTTNKNQIIKCNELMRRLLGIANPFIAYQYIQFSQISLSDICSSPTNLEIFIAEIEQSLIALVEHNWKEKNTVSSATIADLKATYSGATAFHQQVKLRGLSQVEAILYDLREFMDGKSTDCIEVLAGNIKPQVTKVQTISFNNPIELKFNQDQSAKKSKVTNPFSAMFAKQKQGDEL